MSNGSRPRRQLWCRGTTKDCYNIVNSARLAYSQVASTTLVLYFNTTMHNTETIHNVSAECKTSDSTFRCVTQLISSTSIINWGAVRGPRQEVKVNHKYITAIRNI